VITACQQQPHLCSAQLVSRCVLLQLGGECTQQGVWHSSQPRSHVSLCTHIADMLLQVGAWIPSMDFYGRACSIDNHRAQHVLQVSTFCAALCMRTCRMVGHTALSQPIASEFVVQQDSISRGHSVQPTGMWVLSCGRGCMEQLFSGAALHSFSC
jgi:hypothetical protein